MKISTNSNNEGCPQTLFVYGTYKENGEPDFGLFCWFSYMYIDDQMGVMCAIGGDKLTKERILATGEFSANLVTENILPLSDYFGTVLGTNPEKMKVAVDYEKGAKLNVPVLSLSPMSYELKVHQHIVLNDSDVFLCKVVNTLQDERIANAITPEARHQVMQELQPVCTTFTSYYSFDGRYLGEWHGLAKEVK